MEIKIQCGCGTKYKFDVEPVNGRMPMAVVCPGCGASGLTGANQQIAQSYPPFAPPSAPSLASGGGLRISSSASHAAATQSPTASGADDNADCPLLERTTFFVKEQTRLLKLTDAYDILNPATGQKIRPPGPSGCGSSSRSINCQRRSTSTKTKASRRCFPSSAGSPSSAPSSGCLQAMAGRWDIFGAN